VQHRKGVPVPAAAVKLQRHGVPSPGNHLRPVEVVGAEDGPLCAN
jgi:hypothetical protein